MNPRDGRGSFVESALVENDSAPGYRMIESLEIENFRCFEQVALKGLKRINVITGANASGKSALLEAIYLGGNATAAALQNINLARGLVQTNAVAIFGPVPVPFPAVQNPAAMFDHLFRSTLTSTPRKEKLETARKIRLAYTDSESVNYEVSCAYQAEAESPPAPLVRGPGGLSIAIPLNLTRVKRHKDGRDRDICCSRNRKSVRAGSSAASPSVWTHHVHFWPIDGLLRS